MPKVHRSQPLTSRVESLASRLEDAEGQLLEACTARFPEPDFQVEADDKHTVWVRNAEGRSVGLQPWLLRDRSMGELMQRVEKKLGAAPAQA